MFAADEYNQGAYIVLRNPNPKPCLQIKDVFIFSYYSKDTLFIYYMSILRQLNLSSSKATQFRT